MHAVEGKNERQTRWREEYKERKGRQREEERGRG